MNNNYARKSGTEIKKGYRAYDMPAGVKDEGVVVT